MSEGLVVSQSIWDFDWFSDNLLTLFQGDLIGR